MARCTRSDAQKIHAFVRFKQRTGIHFSKKVREFFIRSIKGGVATVVKQQSSSNFVYDVLYEGITHRVVYDEARNNIVTVLFYGCEVKFKKDGRTRKERKQDRLNQIFDKIENNSNVDEPKYNDQKLGVINDEEHTLGVVKTIDFSKFPDYS